MTDTRPRLLDLFCGAGGCTRGYQLAGFHVTGVDIEPQPNYCGDDFIRADIMQTSIGLQRFDAIHASPPCQHYAPVTRWRGRAEDHPDLVAATRQLLESSGRPYVIENVPGAPVRPDLVLCGSQFGLSVRRHRWFECSYRPVFPWRAPCRHRREDLAFEHKNERAFADAMGCGWMTAREAREAIPPAYTEHIGLQLLDALKAAA